jgi:hypothetical protein
MSRVCGESLWKGFSKERNVKEIRVNNNKNLIMHNKHTELSLLTFAFEVECIKSVLFEDDYKRQK